MKNTLQKIKEQTISSITKGCIAAICIYGSEKAQLTSPSNGVQIDNFSKRKKNENTAQRLLGMEDHATRITMLLEMMGDNEPPLFIYISII